MKSKLLLFFLFLSAFVFAQDSVFQIKNYKYRTPGFRALFIQLNASGGVSDPETSTGYAGSDKHFELWASQFGYTRIVSTNRRLHQSTISFTPNYRYTRNDEGAKRTYRQRDLQFSWGRNDRFYKTNQWFFEAGNLFTAGTNGYKNTDTGQRYSQSGRTLHNTVTLGLGKGRVERVQDAQMALFILADLSRQGLLDQPVTSEKAYAFAQLITDINNRRVFDTRRRRIYELTMLDSFLRSSGLVNTTNIRHFTTVNDNWALSINPYRLSGSNWYLHVKPSLGLERNGSKNRFAGWESAGESRWTTKAVSPVIGYERYLPKNLKWQFNMGASVSYETIWQNYRVEQETNGTSSISEGDWRRNSWVLTSFYGLGFFPNNRTQLTGTAELTASHVEEKTASTRYIYIQPSVNVSANYFLGYRTYLTANLSANYQYSRNQTLSSWFSPERRWTTSASIAFSHILF